ncbi:cobalamin B12-binding domain-containing protein [Neomoorella mulderi]|uniref:Methionine synthase n=1 Tax=Moorella mulderi DSM 14980 TaxID=1122241 RepID=A0A151AW85_9FIRM|nr:cobalamin-dependent protein [Moorella mulderi]KYH31915.1 methionine synthase [Moorella mulderi DSM 14980]
MKNEFVEALANLQENEAITIAQKMLESGTMAEEVLELAQQGVDIIGKRYENGEYFLPDLIMAGEILKEIASLVKPRLSKGATARRLGKVLIGTVEGDVHDIGKNIVSFMLEVNGFEVLDLGVDVPPAKFVEAIKEFQPQVVALSGLLTVAFDAMKDTVNAIKEAGLRDKVKIMIGGGQCNENVRQYAGADAYGKDAVEAVALAKKWIGGE